MKCLILTAFVGFCAAGVLTPNGYKVAFTDDDNLMVYGLTGNTFTFTNFPDQRYIDIMINGIDTPMKKIRLNGETCQIMNVEGFQNLQEPMKTLPMVQTLNQGVSSQNILNNYLFSTFKNFQGMLNENQFDQLLNVIQMQVKEGKLCSIIYELMTYLDKMVNEEMIQKYMMVRNQMKQTLVQNQVPLDLLQQQNYMQRTLIPTNMGSLSWLNNIMDNSMYQTPMMNQMPWTMTTMQQPLYTTMLQQPWKMTTMTKPWSTTFQQPWEMTTMQKPWSTTFQQPWKMTTMQQPLEMTTMTKPWSTTFQQPREMTTMQKPWSMVQQPWNMDVLDNQWTMNNVYPTVYGNSRMMDYMMKMNMMGKMQMGKQHQGGLYNTPYNQDYDFGMNYGPMVYRY